MNLQPDTARLPPLREDIRLYPAERDAEGAPAWSLYDPLRNRFFRVGWAEFELLRRWRLGRADELLAAVNGDTPLHLDRQHLLDLLEFLTRNQLVLGRGEGYREQLVHIARSAQPGMGQWLLHHYLFFRIPLVRPQGFLEASYPLVAPLFSWGYLRWLGFFSLLGMFLVSRQWEAFSSTFMHFYSFSGLLLFGIAVSLSKVAHELGHAYAAVRYGLRVPSMGVAFLVLWPVLYTESSEAWRLADKRQRLLIGGAGMLAELGLAALALLLWSFLDDGPMRSAVFMLATSTWVLTLLININPFMRFDGYYLLSDLLGVANLQDRSFALGRWRMREILFGLGRAPPERLSPRLQRWLILYAWGTWVYRFFLFLAIALLVYYLFFKALGLALMLVEVAWFIGRPLVREWREWMASGGDMRWNRQAFGSMLLLLMGLLWLVLPWQRHLDLPAVTLHPLQARLYASEAARLERVYLAEGQQVKAGEPLFLLASPDLDQQILQAEREVELLRLELARKTSGEAFRDYIGVLEEQLAEAKSALTGLLERRSRLEIRSPLDGRLVYLDDTLVAGLWLDGRLLLGRVVQSSQLEVQGFVEGQAVERVRSAGSARFYPQVPGLAPLELKLIHLEDTNTRVLPSPYLASQFGGAVASREDEAGRWISEGTLFRARFRASFATPEGPPAGFDQVMAGQIRLEVEARSPVMGFLRNALAIVVRESGF